MTMVFGQMNEPPGARLRVALTGLCLAEYFRDEEGADTRCSLITLFRLLQAGSEVSAPSPDAFRRVNSFTPGHRDGPDAGADYLYPEGFDYIRTGWASSMCLLTT